MCCCFAVIECCYSFFRSRHNHEHLSVYETINETSGKLCCFFAVLECGYSFFRSHYNHEHLSVHETVNETSGRLMWITVIKTLPTICDR